MNNIHRINDIIKMVPDLKYDSATGLFETDRRALYDFAELIIQECISAASAQRNPPNLNYKPSERFVVDLKQHFGIKDAPKT